MFKRFMLGFLAGVGLMYWYLHNADELFESSEKWGKKTASQYRADKDKRAAEELMK